MSTWLSQYSRDTYEDEQKIYDHLLNLVQSELPEQLVSRFRQLFVEGDGYPDPEIMAALDRIAESKQADQDFQFVLNRCCHILINRWQARPQSQAVIPELVSVFDATPTRRVLNFSRSRSVRRLRSLVEDFRASEQFLTLQRLALVVDQSKQPTKDAPVGSLIRRYPYLYEHCLLTDGSTYEQQAAVRELQLKAQHQYEVDLSQFITYQVRRVRLARTQSPEAIAKQLPPVANPSLLDDRELCGAVRHFVGRSQGTHTYRDVAQRFLANSVQSRSFKHFKQDFYEYLTAGIDPAYAKRQFNNQLYKQLQDIFADSDDQPVNDFLMVRTCSQLLNFLVVESAQQPQHFIFVDLISNLGTTLTTGLLLKIVLICRKVKPYLEKRFSILFNHYNDFTQDSVLWFVKMMENLNVALSTNFSTVDLSVINSVR